MESKELIQSYLYAKAYLLSAAVWKIYWGGGGPNDPLFLGLILLK